LAGRRRGPTSTRASDLLLLLALYCGGDIDPSPRPLPIAPIALMAESLPDANVDGEQ
jgi:hypothetical protein